MTIITGHPITFNTDSVDLGGFVETVDPAAVDRTVREKSEIVLLRNHDSNFPVARRSARSLAIEKQAHGLHIEAFVDEHIGFVADLLRMIKRGDAAGGSFGFAVLDDVWSLRDGKPFRRIVDMTLREVSIGVSFPAYAATRVAVAERSAPAQSVSKESVAGAQRRLKLLLMR